MYAHVPYREGEDVADMRREENSSSLTTDGVMYSYYLTDLNPGSFELTVTPISVVGDNTVLGPESARKMFSVGEWPSLYTSVVTMNFHNQQYFPQHYNYRIGLLMIIMQERCTAIYVPQARVVISCTSLLIT